MENHHSLDLSDKERGQSASQPKAQLKPWFQTEAGIQRCWKSSKVPAQLTHKVGPRWLIRT